jgi:hypothetical protein
LRPFSSRAPLMRSAQTCQHPHFSLSSPLNHFCPLVFLSFPFTAPSSFPISPFPAPPCLPHVCSPSHLPLLTRGEALGGRALLLMDADCAMAQSARLPTSQPMGHHRLLVQRRAVAARARPDLPCTKQVPQRPRAHAYRRSACILPKALTFSRLATDLEVVRVMRILDSAPVASPSTCTPRRLSCRRARRTCPKTGPLPRSSGRTRATSSATLTRASARGVCGPSSRSLHQHFTSTATRQHVPPVLGAEGSSPRNSPPSENAQNMHAMCAPHFCA